MYENLPLLKKGVSYWILAMFTPVFLLNHKWRIRNARGEGNARCIYIVRKGLPLALLVAGLQNLIESGTASIFAATLQT